MYLQLFLLSSIFIQSFSVCHFPISESEYAALNSFYLSCNGNNWHWDASYPVETQWSFPANLTTPCSNQWQGLICKNYSDTSCSVIEIDLTSYGLQGTLPVNIFNLTNLISLSLGSNLLEGEIPSSIRYLSALQTLDLGNNNFTNSLPSEIGYLTQLTSIYVDENTLSGLLPSEIGFCRVLTAINVGGNELSGHIPTELWQLTQLNMLNLSGNSLSGTLPTELGLLVEVSDLFIFSTSLTGTIPAEIGFCESLVWVWLMENQFTGALPTEMGLIHPLAYLFLYSNFLSGGIPTEFGSLQSLLSLTIEENFLSKSAPSEIGLLSELQYLMLFNNYFTSSIPTEIGRLNDLLGIDLSYNLFSGHIPGIDSSRLEWMCLNNNLFEGTLSSELATLRRLEALNVSNCLLTGTIPTAIFFVRVLKYLSLSNNLLTGTLPSNIGELISLQVVDFASNLLSSTIPFWVFIIRTLKEFVASSNWLSGRLVLDCSTEQHEINTTRLESIYLDSNAFSGSLGSIVDCTKLTALSVSANTFTGTLSDTFNGIQFLEYLNVSDNGLVGSVDGLFGSLKHLVVIDLSRNSFSGELPVDIFDVRKARLQEIFLNDNCFSGSLPSQICELKSLGTLVLDSASSAAVCDIRLGGLAGIIGASFAKQFLRGSVPGCIWRMTSLSTLHLSGNGLTGSLGNISSVTSQLTDVELSNNRLVGTIPASWQSYPRFNKLVLSSNRIGGGLSSNFQILNTTLVNLTVNRLSGEIPSAFRSASRVNILEGNLFQCNDMTKPIHDPNSANYACGSSSFNNAYYAWITAALLLVIPLVFIIRGSSTGASIVSIEGDLLSMLDSSTTVPKHLSEYLAWMKSANYFLLILSFTYCCIALPIYLSMKLGANKSESSTHTYQYAWITTIAFLHGAVPTTSMLVLLLLTACFLGLLSWRQDKQRCSACKSCWVFAEGAFHLTADRKSIFLAAVFVPGYSIVALAVNIAYVVAQFNGLSTFKLTVIQLFLALFKFFWNDAVALYIVAKLRGLNESARLLISTFMRIVTVIASPMVATFVSDSSCFRYVFISSGSTTTSFISHSFQCYLSDLFFSPTTNFSLSNSSIFQLGIGCGLAGGVPTNFTTTPVWLYSFQCSSALLVNYVPVLIYSLMFSGLVIPAVKILYSFGSSSWLVQRLGRLSIAKKFMRGIYKLEVDLRGSSAGNAAVAHGGSTSFANSGAFNSIGVLSRAVSNIGIMVTFGLASPLLAIVAFVDNTATLLSFEALLLRYFRMSQAAGGDHFDETLKVLDLKTDLSLMNVGNSVLLIVIIAELFWVIFVFDMIGDVYGTFAGGLAILAPTVGIHLCFLICQQLRTLTSGSTNAVLRTFSGDVQLEGVHRIRSALGLAGVESSLTNPLHEPEKLNNDFRGSVKFGRRQSTTA